jgi:5-(carboxyamino)imidazole ribonucleotide mutase
MEGKVIIMMGSERDLEFSQEIVKTLRVLKMKFSFRIASAHKTPEKIIKILEENENEKVVYITVAGRSNALSAFVDAATTRPVIACPPYSDRFGGVDIYSSLRVPSGVASVTTIEPEGAALAAAKIFGIEDSVLKKRVEKYQAEKKIEIEKADKTVKNLK